jgi:hypothetical protein
VNAKIVTKTLDILQKKIGKIEKHEKIEDNSVKNIETIEK